MKKERQKRRPLLSILLSILLVFFLAVGLTVLFGDINYSRHNSSNSLYQEAIDVYPTKGEMAVPELARGGIFLDQASGAAEGAFIKNYDLRIEVEKIKESQKALEEKIYKHQGEVLSISENLNAERPNLWVSVRVPSKVAKSFFEEVKTLGTIVNNYQNVENVSDRLSYLDSEIEWLEKKEKKLMRLLDKAEEIPDIITIENEVTNVQRQLKYLLDENKNLKENVAFDHFEISVLQKQIFAEESFGTALNEHLASGYVNFINTLKAVLLGISYYFVYYLLVLAFIIVALAVFWSNSKKKKDDKKKAKELKEQIEREAEEQDRLYYEIYDEAYEDALGSIYEAKALESEKIKRQRLEEERLLEEKRLLEERRIREEKQKELEKELEKLEELKRSIEDRLKDY